MKEQARKLNNRERIMATVVLLTLSFVSFKYILAPQKRKLADVKNSIVELQAKNDELKSKFNKLTADRKLASLNQIKAKEKMADYLKSDASFSELLKTLSVSEGAAAIHVKDIQVLNSSNAGDLIETVFKIDLESSFLDLGRFLERLEKSNLLLAVQEVEVQKIEEDLKLCDAKIVVRGLTGRGQGF